MPELNAHTEPVTRTRIEYRVFFEPPGEGNFRIWSRTNHPERIPEMVTDGKRTVSAQRWGVQRAEITELVNPIEWEDTP